MGHEARDKALPTDPSPQITIQPETPVLRAQDLRGSDRVRFRRHPGPVAAERMKRVLHDRHGMQLDAPWPGFFVGFEVVTIFKPKVGFPESDMTAPADSSIAYIRAAVAGD